MSDNYRRMKGNVMKCNIIIDETREEGVTVVLNKPSPLADEIRALCLADEKTVSSFDGSLSLSPSEIFAFTAEDGKTYAVTEKGRLRIRERLYETEALVGRVFVRINQSCIVNVSLVNRFSASIGGSLRVEMKNGFFDYVSRRQIKAVKERLGLK